MMGTASADFVLTSNDFNHKEQMPSDFTCEGNDKSPALTWNGAPEGTKSFVLIMDDPDAPSPDAPDRHTWDHWLVINIPASVNGLVQDVGDNLPKGVIQGKNSWGRVDYGGPCPPKGNHRYYFRLYALDSLLKVKEGITKGDLFKAMEGHILGMAELLGMYQKEK